MTDAPSLTNRASPGVRRFQIVVAAVLMAIFAVPVGWMIEAWRQIGVEREVAARVEAIGGTVTWGGDGIGVGPPRGPRIVAVYLGETEADDDDFAALASLHNLRNLRAGGTKVTDVGLRHLEQLTELETLELRNVGITGDGLRHLPRPSTLKDLDLEKTRLNDQGASYLEDLTALEHLDLSETQITDAALRHLLKMQELEWLELEKTQVTDRGLMQLKGLTQPNATVELRGTQVTDEGLKRFRQEAPNWQATK